MKKLFYFLALLLINSNTLKAQLNINADYNSISKKNQVNLCLNSNTSVNNNMFLNQNNRFVDITNLRKGKSHGLTIGGAILAAVGVGLLVGGIYMVSDSGGETSYSNVNGQESGSLEGGFGAVTAVLGGVCVLGGGAMILIDQLRH